MRLFFIPIACYILVIFAGCTQNILEKTETTQHAGSVYQPREFLPESGKCVAIIQVENNDLVAVGHPFEKCLTLVNKGARVDWSHHITRTGSGEIWSDYWIIK